MNIKRNSSSQAVLPRVPLTLNSPSYKGMRYDCQNSVSDASRLSNNLKYLNIRKGGNAFSRIFMGILMRKLIERDYGPADFILFFNIERHLYYL